MSAQSWKSGKAISPFLSDRVTYAIPKAYVHYRMRIFPYDTSIFIVQKFLSNRLHFVSQDLQKAALKPVNCYIYTDNR